MSSELSGVAKKPDPPLDSLCPVSRWLVMGVSLADVTPLSAGTAGTEDAELPCAIERLSLSDTA